MAVPQKQALGWAGRLPGKLTLCQLSSANAGAWGGWEGAESGGEWAAIWEGQPGDGGESWRPNGWILTPFPRSIRPDPTTLDLHH